MKTDDLDLQKEFGIKSSFVITLLSNEENDKYQDHIFLKLYDKRKKLGVLVHEMLHSAEKTRRINPETGEYEEKTGFCDFGDSGENTIESECIHSIILHKRIFPELKKLGYDLYDENDYDVISLECNNEFFDRFENQILEARCGNEQELYRTVGKENFDRLVQLQNEMKKEIMSPKKRDEINKKAEQVLRDMIEHEKAVTENKTIVSSTHTDELEILKKAYEDIGLSSGDLSKAYKVISRTKEEKTHSQIETEFKGGE